jgi:predicted dehydrogenase
MFRIKILGAGSIGNHIAHAAVSRGWEVTLTDIDPAALERTRSATYPGRYGAWNEAIRLKESRAALGDKADVVFIGTPPDTHIALANAELDAAVPRALLIEKPLCGPDLKGCAALLGRTRQLGIFAGVGYNHTLTPNTLLAEERLRAGAIGPVVAMSARTREHWGGIFKAHPWLSGPADSYLGFAARGGGAAGEHSHGINIWQHFAEVLGAGKIHEVTGLLDLVEEGRVNYDRLMLAGLRTTEGLVGEVIQDVVTAPPEKLCRIQGRDGFVEWRVNHKPGFDAVICGDGERAEEQLLAKTRADDFKTEIEHLEAILEGKRKESPIALERGLDTMLVIAAIFRSHATGRKVRIDWSAGYGPDALR